MTNGEVFDQSKDCGTSHAPRRNRKTTSETKGK